LVALLAAGRADADEPITLANWVNHPAIKEVRGVYAEVQSLATAMRLNGEVSQHCEEGRFGATASAYQGVVRLHVFEGATDDQWGTESSYYDAKGVLRFIFFRRGAWNGATKEARVYFDASGRQIWSIEKHTGEYAWAEGPEIVRDPREAVRLLCDDARRGPLAPIQHWQ
jgi:hypothetical protein